MAGSLNAGEDSVRISKVISAAISAGHFQGELRGEFFLVVRNPCHPDTLNHQKAGQDVAGCSIEITAGPV